MKDQIDAVVNAMLEKKGLPARELREHEHLVTDVGLDSLDIAELVTRLEMQFDVDPFALGAGAEDYGAFVRIYADAVAESEAT